MDRHRVVLVALASALLVVVSAQTPNCDLSDPAALSQCIKHLLIDSRDKIKRKVDPLHVNNFSGEDLTLTDIVVKGIGSYNVDSLSVTFPQPSKIAVRATISWPRLVANANAKLKACKWVIFKFCTTFRGRPELTVGRSSGTLSTIFSISITPGGQVLTKSSDTKVITSLSDIRIEPNLRGFWGFINRNIGDPAKRKATEAVHKFWREKKSMLEGEAKMAVDEAVSKELSVSLGKILNIGSVSVPVTSG